MRRLCAFLLTVLLAPTQAQEAPLFASDEPLALTLTFDTREVTRDRSETPPWYPATLTLSPEATLDIGVRTRGFYRLNYLDCDVPPLRLNIRTREAGGTVFENQDKLKLVTHCENGREAYQQYVLQEYLIYRAYALLADVSFKTRLVHITYRDATGRRDDVTRYGFLIEDDKQMAARVGGEIATRKGISPEATDREEVALMSVFHYMVGNTDWTISTLHNIRLVYFDSIVEQANQSREFSAGPRPSPLVAVPYDFDWSGLISTPYATPDPQLRLRSVRDRKYMGFCRSPEEFETVLARFRSRETDLYDLFRTFPYLEPRVAEQSVEYLQEFFEQVRTERGVERAFLRDCYPE